MDCHDALMLQHVRRFHPGTKHSAGETHHVVPSQQEISVSLIFHRVVYAVLRNLQVKLQSRTGSLRNTKVPLRLTHNVTLIRQKKCGCLY